MGQNAVLPWGSCRVIFNLRKLHKKFGVSADYILYGEKASREEMWDTLLNCSESDKILLFLRLFQYLSKDRPEIYLRRDRGFPDLEEAIRLIMDEREK